MQSTPVVLNYSAYTAIVSCDDGNVRVEYPETKLLGELFEMLCRRRALDGVVTIQAEGLLVSHILEYLSTASLVHTRDNISVCSALIADYFGVNVVNDIYITDLEELVDNFEFVCTAPGKARMYPRCLLDLTPAHARTRDPNTCCLPRWLSRGFYDSECAMRFAVLYMTTGRNTYSPDNGFPSEVDEHVKTL